MPERQTLAAMLYPGEGFERVAADRAETPEPIEVAPVEGTFVPPLRDAAEQPPIVSAVYALPTEQPPVNVSEQLRPRRVSPAVIFLAGIGVAAGLVALGSATHIGQNNAGPELGSQPGATATSPQSEASNNPFASASPNTTTTTPPAKVTMINYLAIPPVFGTAKNHAVNSADATIGAFKVRFTFNNQTHEYSFPGGTINMFDSSNKVGYTTTKQPDTKTGYYNTLMTLKSATISHSSNINVPLSAIGDRIVTKPELLKEQGDATYCTGLPTAQDCPKGPKSKTNLTPTRLKSVKSSIEVLAFYAAQQQCAVYAADIMLASINKEEDAFVDKMNVPADDMTVVFDTKKPFNYVAAPVSHLKGQGALTKVSALQAIFGNQVSIPVTCNS